SATLWMRVPEGWAASNSHSLPSAMLSESSVSLRWIQPLRREARFRLTCRDGEGHLVDDATLDSAAVDGGMVTPRWNPSTGDVAGIPFTARASVTLAVSRPTSSGSRRTIRWQGSLPRSRAQTVTAEIDIPALDEQAFPHVGAGGWSESRANVGPLVPWKVPT